MSTSTIFKSVVALLVAAAIVGGYFYPKFSIPAGATPVGSTFNTAKTAAISFNPATGTATSTSILNPAGQDVYVTGNFIGCGNATSSLTAYTGTGLAQLIFKAATTSTAAPATVTNVNLVMNDVIATGTAAMGAASDYGGNVLVASSSIATTSTASGVYNQAFASSTSFRWAAGTYLTFWANATNTAQCTVGVNYFSS